MNVASREASILIKQQFCLELEKGQPELKETLLQPLVLMLLDVPLFHPFSFEIA